MKNHTKAGPLPADAGFLCEKSYNMGMPGGVRRERTGRMHRAIDARMMHAFDLGRPSAQTDFFILTMEASSITL